MLSRAGFHLGVKVRFTGPRGEAARPSKQGQVYIRRPWGWVQVETTETFLQIHILRVESVTYGLNVLIVLLVVSNHWGSITRSASG